MSLRSVNHNLLPLLRSLLRERNVTRAAAHAGLSQPAASKALAQLRAILGDPLLVRTGRQFALTRRAEALIGPVERVCQELEAIWEPATFDARTTHREFVIAAADYCALLVVPRLAAALATEAPGVTMRFVDIPPQIALTRSQSIDFVMAPASLIPPVEPHHIESLFIDEFVTAVSANHAFAQGAPPSNDDIKREPHILFGSHENETVFHRLYGPTPEAKPDRVLAVVQQFGALPLLAATTGCVIVAPRRLVELVDQPLPLHILISEQRRHRFETCLAWSPRHDSDAAHNWFRSLVIAKLRDDRLRDDTDPS